MKKTFIIAEAGVNHNGSMKLAKELIDVAVASGANAVKFQTFKAESLVTRAAPKAAYQLKSTDTEESQFKMIKRLELTVEDHKQLMEYCRFKNIEFLSTPFDIESVHLLIALGLEMIKIPSGEITNLPYLQKIGSLAKRTIMSTGMADMNEIRDALNVLINAGAAKNDITVLHCNTEYPTPIEDVNLRAMISIRDALDVKVGYSDHTQGIEVPIAAVALGAEVIEKHFTLDKGMEGPDHRASLDPDELTAMVSNIRSIEKVLGDGVKRPSPSEMKNRSIVRKSIVAARNIDKGEVFSENNLAIKRPGTGISPMKWDEVIGIAAPRSFRIDEAIEV